MEAERHDLDVADIARGANVPADFVKRLIELGAPGRWARPEDGLASQGRIYIRSRHSNPAGLSFAKS